MEILTGSQMRRVDARAIEGRGIASETLMEAAGRGVAEAMAAEIPDLARREIVVVCGKGNNGGDGLVAARHLLRAGAKPRVVLLARSRDLSGDPELNHARAIEAGVRVTEAPDAAAWVSCASLDAGTVVVDAVLGTGVSGGARGLAAQAIEDINAARCTVLAIDLPSGIDADTGRADGPAILAHRTYTLCRPKAGLVLEPGASHAGPFLVIDIGIPDEDVAAEAPALSWTDADAAVALLPPRPAGGHKGTFGHLLALAGSRGKSGAAILLARAALRSGVGLVTAATSRSAQPLVAGAQPEVMTEPLPETRSGALSAAAAGRAARLLAERTALAMGPGLGTERGTRAVVAAMLRGRAAPCVLDADGLNAAAIDRLRPRRGGPRPPLVLTPHPGEAARLLGVSVAEIQADRLGAARRLADLWTATVVLKGRRSVVAEPGGRAAINASGNAGMATGGTGDALTGVVGALLARGMSGFDAARLATYVHGDAGDRAADRLGGDGMMAGDLVEALPGAWKDLHDRRAEGRRWTRDD